MNKIDKLVYSNHMVLLISNNKKSLNNLSNIVLNLGYKTELINYSINKVKVSQLLLNIKTINPSIIIMNYNELSVLIIDELVKELSLDTSLNCVPVIFSVSKNILNKKLEQLLNDSPVYDIIKPPFTSSAISFTQVSQT